MSKDFSQIYTSIRHPLLLPFSIIFFVLLIFCHTNFSASKCELRSFEEWRIEPLNNTLKNILLSGTRNQACPYIYRFAKISEIFLGLLICAPLSIKIVPSKYFDDKMSILIDFCCNSSVIVVYDGE